MTTQVFSRGVRPLACVLLLLALNSRPVLAQLSVSTTPNQTTQEGIGAVGQGKADSAKAKERDDGAPKNNQGQGSSVAATDGNCSPACPPKKTPPAWLLVVVFFLSVLLMYALHWFDSYHAYRFSKESRDALLAKIGGNLSPEQFATIAKLQPTGVSGTTRSIFTYGLLALLGAAVFYFLAFSDAPKAPEYADKILTVLAGAVSSIIGFYFGSKATREGITTGAAQREDKPTNPGGGISGVDPKQAHHGDVVTIEGTGFGDPEGTVQFENSSAKPISAEGTEEWHPNLIRVKVPGSVPVGKARIVVNPKQAARIVSSDSTPFEII